MRTNVFVWMVAIALMASSGTMCAQNAMQKSLAKQLKKEYKQKKKDFKKGGWKMFDSTRSMDVALLKHYNTLESAGGAAFEIVGYSSAKSMNLASTAALASACARYATQASGRVKGKLLADMSNNSLDATADFDKFLAIYQTNVEKEIKGELVPSFSVIRTNQETGLMEVQAFFTINSNRANDIRQFALEKAKAESDFAKKNAHIISDYIKESFQPDNSEQ